MGVESDSEPERSEGCDGIKEGGEEQVEQTANGRGSEKERPFDGEGKELRW